VELTSKIGLPHFHNYQTVLDLDLSGSKTVCLNGAGSRLNKIISDVDPDLILFFNSDLALLKQIILEPKDLNPVLTESCRQLGGMITPLLPLSDGVRRVRPCKSQNPHQGCLLHPPLLHDGPQGDLFQSLMTALLARHQNHSVCLPQAL
jgi:hypothetical protein